MDVIYDGVKTIVVFLILVAIVMNLLGTSSYKKYVSIFTGMLLVSIVITPLMKLFNLTDSMDYTHYVSIALKINNFKIEAKDMNEKIFDADEKQKSYITQEYTIKLKEQLEKNLNEKNLTLKKCDFTIDEDMASEKFGKVIAVDIVANEFTANDDNEDKKKIMKDIIIEDIRIGEEEPKSSRENSKISSVQEIELSKEIAEFYNIDSELVHVDIGIKE